MKQRIILMFAFILAVAQGWAATNVNGSLTDQIEQFAAQVGQTDSHIVVVSYESNGNDPNDPVIMSNGNGTSLQAGAIDRLFQISIDGDDSNLFTAEVTSATSSSCLVTVTYFPIAVGTHSATLNVHSLLNNSSMSIQLMGTATKNPFATHTSGVDSSRKWNGVELNDGVILPDGSDPTDYVTDGHAKRGGSDIFGFIPIPDLEYEESPAGRLVSFRDVTVGTSVTKEFEIKAENLHKAANLIKSFINFNLEKMGSNFRIDHVEVKLKIAKTNFVPGGAPDAITEIISPFSVSPNSFWPWDIDDEKTKINVTFSPTIAGEYEYKIVAIYEYYDKDNRCITDLLGLTPIEQTSSTNMKTASAVERTITVDPTSHDFGTVEIGEKPTQTFSVTGTNLTGEMTLSSDNSYFKVTPKTLPASGGTVTVTYEPNAIGSHNAILTISGGDTPGPQTVDLSGTAVNPAPPSITVDETPINFGTVTLGDNPATKTIIVKGTNLTEDLNLSISGVSGSMFTAQPYRISPADAKAGKPVVVTYKPTAAGTHTATLHITGGGAENGPIDISLSGKCVKPSITITPSTYDFETVNLGDSKPMTFTITGNNLRDRISMVTQMETTGGEYTVTPTDLPATGGTVTVTYKPIDEGSSSAVFTFGSGNESAKITVSGKCVIPPTITGVPSSLDFGTVIKGKTSSKTFTVKGYNLTSNLTLSSNRPYFTVSPSTITPVEAAAGKKVTVTYEPTAGGNHSATLTINGGGADPKTVSLTGKCAAITANPSSYAFETVNLGDSKPMTFTITGTNLSERISMVSVLETEGGEYSITPQSLPASGGTVTITYKPLNTGSSSAVFTLASGDVYAKITVSGKCVTPPAITVNPTSLDFGTVAKNSTNKKTFTVKGTNLTGNLTVSPASSSYFTVSPTTITAAQAMSANGVEVTVTYKPTARGSHSATFTISGDGATSKTVKVTGKCAEITTSKTDLRFASNSSQTFTVTGYNLSGNLTLTSSGAPFTVSPKSITPSQAAAGVTVTVTCYASLTLPKTTGSIIIKGGGASPKTVNLTYDPTGMEPQAGLILPEDGNEDGNSEFTNGGSLEAFGNSVTDVEELAVDAKIFAEGQNIIIESPIEQSAMISDISGRARSVNLQVGRNEVPVNASGIYIVRVREKTVKLMLK